ncbi:MAG: Holliday junction branch migration protein RuvA [Thermoleophilia bacterium]
MIASLRGTLQSLDGERAVVEVGGFGVEVLASARTLSALAPQRGREVTLFTSLHLVTRSDVLQLFGFQDAQERALFHLLTGVTGVGPKLALGVLSAYPAEELRVAIARDDVKKLESITGVGKRTAQRIVVELKDRVGQLPHGTGSVDNVNGPAPTDGAYLEARSALQNLGLSLREAEEALRGAPEGIALEELLRYAFARDGSSR